MRRILALSAAALLAITTAGCSNSTTDSKNTPSAAPASEAPASKELNVYSSRHYDVDKKLYEQFEQETGIKVNVVEGKSGEIIERILREKDSAAADIFLTVGAESIYKLNEEKAFEDYESEVVSKNIPAKYRGKNWMGIVSRARVIAYSKANVDPASIKTYADITKPEWKGQLLARSSSSSYNKALVSSFVETEGEATAKEWAQGVVNNFARDPKGNDRDQAKAIVAGEGKLAIMNSYYWVRMSRSSDPEEKKVSEEVGLIFPEKTHVNLSYAAVLNGAKNKANAVKFMEFLSGEKIQNLIANENGEFPLNEKAEMPEPQKSWLGFTTQDIDFAMLGKSMPTATKIFDEVGWK